jgi:hypothetical protein
MEEKDPHWIEHANMKKGALRKELGVKGDEKIPEKKIEKGERSDNPKLAARSRLATTLSKLRSK